MNKRAYIFYLTVFIAGFVIAYLSGVKIGEEEGSDLSDQLANVNDNSESETNIEGFWVKIKDEKVIVYKNDGTTVIAETDIDIRNYSEEEQNILANGIYLETSEQLFKFLESNTS